MILPPTPQVTEQTMAAVCKAMLRSMVKDPNICRRMAALGAVPHIRRILLDPLKAVATSEERGQPQHPELQAYLAMMLAELAFHCSSGAALRSKKLDMLRSTFKDDT